MERVVQLMDEVDELLLFATQACSTPARRIVIGAFLLASLAVCTALV